MSLAFVLCMVSLLVIPAVMVFCGKVRQNLCGRIGDKFGYKSELSMVNMEAWNYAQNACPVRYMVTGVILAVAAMALLFMAIDAEPVAVVIYSMTLLLAQILTWGFVIISVESGLRKLLGVKNE